MNLAEHAAFLRIVFVAKFVAGEAVGTIRIGVPESGAYLESLLRAIGLRGVVRTA